MLLRLHLFWNSKRKQVEFSVLGNIVGVPERGG